MSILPNADGKGPGLARGPALLLGSVLFGFGLAAMIGHADFPPVSDFPSANVEGEQFLGFEVNGWTNWLLILCGGLLLFGSAQHLLAKTMSGIVGAALGVAALLALLTGDILGLGASNLPTAVGLLAASGALLLNVFAPRIGRKRHTPTTTTTPQSREKELTHA